MFILSKVNHFQLRHYDLNFKFSSLFIRHITPHICIIIHSSFDNLMYRTQNGNQKDRCNSNINDQLNMVSLLMASIFIDLNRTLVLVNPICFQVFLVLVISADELQLWSLDVWKRHHLNTTHSAFMEQCFVSGIQAILAFWVWFASFVVLCWMHLEATYQIKMNVFKALMMQHQEVLSCGKMNVITVLLYFLALAKGSIEQCILYNQCIFFLNQTNFIILFIYVIQYNFPT